MSDPVLESFESYADIGTGGIGTVSKWIYLRNQNRFSLIPGRYGGQALRIESQANTECPAVYRPLGLTTNMFACHFNFRLAPGNQDSKTTNIGFGNAPNRQQFGLRFHQDGHISISTDSRQGNDTPTATAGTLIYSSTNGLFQAGIWNNCSLIGFVHDSTGYVGVKINGDLVFLASGLDTRGQADNDSVNNIHLLNTNNNDLNDDCPFDIDDIYFVPDSSTYIPEGRAERLVAVSDGAHLDLVPSSGSAHYACVDGLADSADYLQGSTPGEYDLLGLSDLSTIPAAIMAVLVVAYAAKTDSGSRAINLGIDSGGTTSLGDDTYLSTDIAKYERILTQDPDTSGEWFLAAINALQARPTIAV